MSINKKKILAGALELFSNFGYTKVSMEELSQHLGISKKTLYNNFTNKDTLFEEVIRYGADSFIRQMETVAQQEEQSFMEKLHKMMNIAFEGIRNRERVFFKNGVAPIIRDVKDPVFYIRERLLQMIRELMRQGQNQGVVRKDISLDKMVSVLLNMLVGATMWDTTSTIPMSRAEVLKESVRISFEGILTPQWRVDNSSGSSL